MKTCSVQGCNNSLLARGWCRKHYLRWYKHGDHLFVLSPQDYILKGEASPNYKHGEWCHPLYRTWTGMMNRCYNSNEQSYVRYGARGVDVCERWHDLRNFIADMHPRPKGHSLDRIDNEKGYSPDNCRWANTYTQGRNRRSIKLNMEKARLIRAEPRRARNGTGSGLTRKEIASKYGVSVATVKKVRSGAYWAEGVC